MRLAVGKLPPEVLESYVFSRIGVANDKVIVGPSVGEDAAIIDMGNGMVLVAHSDPITEAVERIGWLSVHVASNDIAVRGVKPQWFLSTILLPPSSSLETLDTITKQIDSALKEVGGAIVGGHTEISPGVDKPIVVMTALGTARRDEVILTRGAQPGDYILVTKGVGIEGTAIIASDFKDKLIQLGVNSQVIGEALQYFNEISVLKEALALAKAKLVTSMHDPTEGGLINGLIEIAKASNNTIEVHQDKIPVRKATKTICEALDINPLNLISSGTLIATVRPNNKHKAQETLQKLGVQHSIIGKVVKGEPKVILYKTSGEIEEYGDYVKDEISKLWS